MTDVADNAHYVNLNRNASENPSPRRLDPAQNEQVTEPHPAAAAFFAAVGPLREAAPRQAEIIESVDCGSYTRDKITYTAGSGVDIPAYLCRPKNLISPAPAVFCHHQHAGNFALGKSECVGLAG
ncbi:hypothetical protein WBG06_16565 [Nocardioides sp. CCNWLW239]|uniref:hypothetical protein n=1 Tax=Nocardioides sp. CCNWLW239 TaxID=3128902 RepID=UPI003017A16E